MWKTRFEDVYNAFCDANRGSLKFSVGKDDEVIPIPVIACTLDGNTASFNLHTLSVKKNAVKPPALGNNTEIKALVQDIFPEDAGGKKRYPILLGRVESPLNTVDCLFAIRDDTGDKFKVSAVLNAVGMVRCNDEMLCAEVSFTSTKRNGGVFSFNRTRVLLSHQLWSTLFFGHKVLMGDEAVKRFVIDPSRKEVEKAAMRRTATAKKRSSTVLQEHNSPKSLYIPLEISAGRENNSPMSVLSGPEEDHLGEVLGKIHRMNFSSSLEDQIYYFLDSAQRDFLLDIETSDAIRWLSSEIDTYDSYNDDTILVERMREYMQYYNFGL